MTTEIRIAIDIVAIFTLVFAIYSPRHHRRDMIVPLLVLNIGVLGVSTVLSATEVNAGLGLGLFGVLSIIRLRSDELGQQEVAYYFAALGIGLLGGISAGPDWVSPALTVALLAAVYIGDHPRLYTSVRRQNVTLDRAITSEPVLIDTLETLLGGTVLKMDVRRVDLVADTTSVEVRFRLTELGQTDSTHAATDALERATS